MEKILAKLARYFENHWRLAVLDFKKGLWCVAPIYSNIAYLKAQNLNGRHILMQPLHPSHYLLVDDLTRPLVCRHHRYPQGRWKPGRMVVETSSQNFQVWIHSHTPLTLQDKRYWLKLLRSDPAADPANRFGRCPGFCNPKEKYRSQNGHYPLSRLIWIDWQTKAIIPPITPEVSSKSPTISFPFTPMGGVCHQSTICRKQFDCGDESRTDFSYALALLRRGFNDMIIRERILTERTCWDSHQGTKRINHYLTRTIQRAKNLVQNNDPAKNSK